MPTDLNITTDTPNPRAPTQAPRVAPCKPKRISPAKQRKLVENAIERLVDLLDAIEPNADLEDNGDAEPDQDGEPTMGWQNEGGQTCLHGQQSDGDNESSLGWTDMEARDGRFGDSCSDLEEQCEDEGAQCDDDGVPNDEAEPDYRNYGIPF